MTPPVGAPFRKWFADQWTRFPFSATFFIQLVLSTAITVHLRIRERDVYSGLAVSSGWLVILLEGSLLAIILCTANGTRRRVIALFLGGLLGFVLGLWISQVTGMALPLPSPC